MTAPWGNPPPPDRRGHRDFIGRSVLTIVGGTRFGVKTQYGTQDVVHVTIVSLAGADAGAAYTDVHVYTARIAGRLRACEPGQVVLSKVVDKGKAADLEDPDVWDQAAATAWFNADPNMLNVLRQGAINDFRSFLANEGSGGGQAVQPIPAPQAQPAFQPGPQYTQPAPVQQQQPVAPNGWNPQQVQPQQQPAYQPPSQQSGPPLPPSWSPAQPQSAPPDPWGQPGPPSQPPPQTYQPQPNATLGSMSAPPSTLETSRTEPQSDQPPF